MKKALFLSLVCAAVMCVFMLPALHASDAPEDMVLSMPEGQEATQPPVDFSHVGHGDFECAECHHKWDGSGAVTPCSTEGCHSNYASKKGADSFYGAFHDRQSMHSCLGCHKAEGGPIKCTDCHVR